MGCGVGSRSGLDPMFLWLWCRPAAVALILPLAWEPPYTVGVALKSKKRKKRKRKKGGRKAKPWSIRSALLDFLGPLITVICQKLSVQSREKTLHESGLVKLALLSSMKCMMRSRLRGQLFFPMVMMLVKPEWGGKCGWHDFTSHMVPSPQFLLFLQFMVWKLIFSTTPRSWC